MPKFVMLLVEDDPLQREIMSALLSTEGYEVIECSTAEAAELVIASIGAELQALVTDNNLAGTMTGIQLAEFAFSKFPQLNIILMSGTWPIQIPKHAVFLPKPLSPERFLDAVSR